MTARATPALSIDTVLINRNYAYLWAAQAISSLGDAIYDMTLIVWIAAVIARQANGQLATWAPIATSGVLVAVALPSLFFGPIAGVFVDRWDKKKIMLWSDFLRLLLILCLVCVTGLAFLPWQPNTTVQLGAIYITVFLTSICSQFFTPAQSVLISDVVDKEHLERASGLAQTSRSIAMIMGPPLAAPVLFSIGVQWALAFNALTFLISFLCVRAVRTPSIIQSASTEGQVSFGHDFFEGIRFSFKNRVLQVLFVTVIVASLGAGAINALMVFFVTQNLHVNVTSVGLLDSFFGVGIIGGSILMSVFASKVKIAQAFTAAILAFGVLFLALARTANVFIALGILLLIGVAQAVINVALVPIALKTVPREMLGRALGTLNPLGVLASLISVSLAGYLASSLFQNFHGSFLGIVIGPIDTIFSLAALLFIVSGLYALTQLRSSAVSDI